MIQPPYTTGTARVTAGSAVVTGTTTAWGLGLVSGGLFTRQGLAVPIVSVESNTSLTLAYPWPGATGTGAYAIDLGRADAASAIVANRRLAEYLAGLAAISIFGESIVSAPDAAAARTAIEALSTAAGAVGTANLANSGVTLAKLQSVASGTFLARSATGTGALQALTAAQAAALLGISSTLQGNGILRLPLGFVLQWGVSANGSAAEYSHAFPVAFPTECLCALGSVSRGSGYPTTYAYAVSTDTFSATSMAFRKRRAVNGGVVEATADGFEIRWIAIGR